MSNNCKPTCDCRHPKILVPLKENDFRKVNLEGDIKSRHLETFSNREQDDHDFKLLANAGIRLLKEKWLARILAKPYYYLFLKRHGVYIDECNHLAKLMNMDVYYIYLLQRLYLWSKLGAKQTNGFTLGCSAACYYQPGVGMFLARCLDWPKPEEGLGEATRIIDYQRAGTTEYKAVHVLGMTGQLSILKPGKFAIVINWAPEHGMIGLKMDPTHRLRKIAEDPAIDSYEKAVMALTSKNNDIGADVFFTVAGIRHEEMCVVERKGSSNISWVRSPEVGNNFLVQTNHYDPAGSIGKYIRSELVSEFPEGESGYCKEVSESSLVRQRVLSAALSAIVLTDPDIVRSLQECLNIVPVRNNGTRQQMVMHIETGNIDAWREIKKA